LSASSAPAINFAENRTFRDFVLLYTIMSVLILSLLSTIYYQYSKEVMLSEHRLAMQLQSESYIPRLKRWMQGDAKEFPIDLAYKTALFDEQKNVIHSRVESEVKGWKEAIALDGEYVHFIVPLASYELGEHYLVFETPDDRLWYQQAWTNILGFGSVVFVLLLTLGWYLSRLFLRPMREAIELLDHFIKDTTHELNTPVAAIMTNVESLPHEKLDEKVRRKLRRIEIAARTISTLYDDLTYMVFNQNRARNDETLNLKELIAERIEYFRDRFEQKRLTLTFSPDEDVELFADRTKMMRVVDNLLSNAIKYNRIGGTIGVEVNRSSFVVSDSGIGIPEEKIESVKERYVRAKSAEGGFGVGLHIVSSIAKEYGWELKIESKEGEGSRFEVVWQRCL